MKKEYGVLLKDDSIIAEDITVHYQCKIDPVSNLSGWDGTISLDSDNFISPGDYQLLFSDGKTGKIVISDIKMNNFGKVIARFKGNGSLE